MATLARSIRSVNTHLIELLPEQIILDASQAVGHRWRQRKLGPAQTVLLLILRVLSANASLAKLRAINGYATSVSALSKAQNRLPVALLQWVSTWLLERFLPDGPRVLRIDCSNTYTHDTPSLRKKYRHPKQKRCRCDYPQLRSICVFEVTSGLLIAEHRFSSDHQESPQLPHVLAMLRRDDIVIFDRGFVSYANLCMLRASGVQVIARLAKPLLARHGTRRVIHRQLGKNDALVHWSKPTQPTTGFQRAEWKRLPRQLPLRQISRPIIHRNRCQRRIHLITTLLDSQTHSSRRIGEWYRRRWEIETDFRHLKQTLGLEMLRSKSPAGVDRELLMRTIAYNLVRIVMLKAAKAKKIECDRISFADACRWLLVRCEHIPLTKLLTNPRRSRPPRPRKLKYRGKNYCRLTRRASQEVK